MAKKWPRCIFLDEYLLIDQPSLYEGKVPKTGLEPALITQPDPKSGASTNSATSAAMCRDRYVSRGSASCNRILLVCERDLIFLGCESEHKPTCEQNNDQRQQAYFQIGADPWQHVAMF